MRLTPLILSVALSVALALPVVAQSRRNNTATPAADQGLQPVPGQNGQFCTKYQTANNPRILVGIDRTTRQIRTVERNNIPTTIDDAATLAQPGDRVIVFSIYEHASSRVILFDDCRPGKPFSVWDRPLNLLEVEHDTQQFQARLALSKTAAIAPLPGRQTRQSAIASTLLGVSRDYNGPVKAMLLMTDLLDSETLQLSPTQAVNDYARATMIESMARSGTIPDLRDAVVRIRGFGLSDTAQNNVYDFVQKPVMDSILRVWADYFRAARVQTADIHFIP
jgi:hypothetical protein